jgi:hypothetical protein
MAVPFAALPVFATGVADTSWLEEQAGAGDSALNPYIITTADELAGLAVLVNEGNNFGNKYIKLDPAGDSIDLSVYTDWTPIGTASNSFHGNFDGNGKIIENLIVDVVNHAGLFGFISNASVTNLGLDNVNVSGYDYVGGIAGYATGSGEISGCYVSGEINTIPNGDYVGGIVGESQIPVYDCISYADVIGGTGENGRYVGGIAGKTSADISSCIATGEVSGVANVGGIVGYINGSDDAYAYVYDCFALNYGVFASSNANVGSIAGNVAAFGEAQNNFEWGNITVSGDEGTYSAYGQPMSTYTINNKTISAIWDDFATPIWDKDGVIPVLEGFPDSYKTEYAAAPDHISGATHQFNGAGTSTNPYLITFEEDLEALATLVNGGESFYNKYFKLTSDIELVSAWTPIGTEDHPFSGYFNGDYHEITELSIESSSDYQGLFGLVVESYAGDYVVKNLAVSGSVEGGQYVGLLAGRVQSGDIENCYVNGTVSGTSYVGGMVGAIENVILINSRSDSEVSATGDRVGGITGRVTEGQISKCITTGSVSSSSVSTPCVGGIAGLATDSTILINAVLANVTKNGEYSGRIIGSNDGSTLSGNIAWADMIGDWGAKGSDSINGSDVAKDNLKLVTTWEGFTTGWTVVADKIPVLTGFDEAVMSSDLPANITGDFLGAGTMESPYLIRSEADLQKLADRVNTDHETFAGKYFELQNDITLTSEWTPIGTQVNVTFYPFQGKFDGGGHVISGLTVTDGSVASGLFRSAGGSGSQISNLGLVDVDITTSSNAGGIVGSVSDGLTIYNCFVTGEITGLDAGGIVGSGGGSFTITNCYNAATVTSNNTSQNYAQGAGGIYGSAVNATPSVSYCYNTGTVSNPNSSYRTYIGGIAGDPGSSNIRYNVVLSESVTNSGGGTPGRIGAYDRGGSYSNNYAWDGLTASNEKGATTNEGADFTYSQIADTDFWTETVPFDTDVWTIAADKLPILKGFTAGSQSGTIPEYMIPASTVATISGASLGGVTNGTPGTPAATYNGAGITAGSVTLTTTQATEAAFSAITSDDGATVEYAYTATDTAPTFNATWTAQTVADDSFVWIKVTAEDEETILIYKFQVTIDDTVTYTDVTFEAEQVGGTEGTADTTGIELTFSESVTGLTADKIRLLGEGNVTVTAGTLTGEGTEWTIGITIDNAGTVYVAVDDFGTFDVTNSEPFEITVHKDNPAIEFEDLTANGASGTVDTTELTLTFEEDIPGLVVTDITVTGATRYQLSKPAETTGIYKLSILEIVGTDGDGLYENGDSVTVAVSKTGLTFNPSSKNVTVHKNTSQAPLTGTLTINGVAKSGKDYTASFTPTVDSPSGLIFAWYYEGDAVYDDIPISIGAILTFPEEAIGEKVFAVAFASNYSGYVQSQLSPTIAELTNLTGTVTISGNPYVGEIINTTITASATGLPADATSIIYSWYTEDGANDTLIAQQYEFPLTTDDLGKQIYVTVTSNNYGSITSALTAPVSYPPAATPSITSQPQTATYAKNGTATALSVTVTAPTDGGTLTYQWYSNDENSNSGGSTIGSATSSTYTPTITTAGTTYYYCIVTNTADGSVATATSSAAAITVLEDASVDTTSATYTQTVSGSITIALTPESYTLTGISDEYEPLTAGQDYTISPVNSNVFIISTDYLDSLIADEHTLTFDMSGGVDPTVTLTIEDIPDDFVAVSSISLSSDTANINDPLTLIGVVSPSYATIQEIDWRVTNDGGTGASINGNQFTATAVGTATITATITDGTGSGIPYTQSFTITVTGGAPINPPVSVSGVSVSGLLEVEVGDTISLTADIEPLDATNQNVTWTSSDPDVAAVDSTGAVTGRNAGTVTITATSIDGGIQGTITITVNPVAVAPAAYSVTVDGVNQGLKYAGTEVTVTATVPSGQEFVSWTVSGLLSLSGSPATFTMPANDVILTANFRDIPTTPAEPSTPSEPPAYDAPPPPTPPSAPNPSNPSAPANEENPYVLPSMDVEQTDEGTAYVAPNGVKSTVIETEDEGIKVEAGINESGAVNAQATKAAVAEAAQIAQENGESSFVLQIPDNAKGLSANTIQQLVEAAGGLDITLELTAVVDGEVVGGVTLPLSSSTGQILTGLAFETKRTAQVEDYVAEKFDAEVLGSFETAQKGGWGDEPATLSVGLDKLGFEAEDGTKLQALIYDPKAKKWYTAEAEIIDGNVVIITKRSGLVTIIK